MLKISGHKLDEKEKDMVNIIKTNTQKISRDITEQKRAEDALRKSKGT